MTNELDPEYVAAWPGRPENQAAADAEREEWFRQAARGGGGLPPVRLPEPEGGAPAPQRRRPLPARETPLQIVEEELGGIAADAVYEEDPDVELPTSDFAPSSEVEESEVDPDETPSERAERHAGEAIIATASMEADDALVLATIAVAWSNIAVARAIRESRPDPEEDVAPIGWRFDRRDNRWVQLGAGATPDA